MKESIRLYHLQRSRCRMPSKSYVMTCLEGYKTFGFSPKYPEDALKRTMEVNNESNN